MEDKWQQIANDIISPDTESLSNKGSLVVVGSGIMCASHFTMETLAHIKDADKVFYLVSDPVTEVYIQELKPDAIDLFILYGEDKDRHETYAQITQVLLYYTRRGYKVVAVFYGHPGYLVNPSREAIKRAKSEGLFAVELPAISSLDTMISDLVFEPGIPGLQVLEATDLLMYTRKLMTDCHVVINQIGSVGDVTFHFNGFPNPHFPVLIEYLIDSYGNDHVVYHYVGSQFPVCESLVERFKLADLLKTENAANIQSMSTMYIPPLNKGTLDLEMAKRIGMVTVRNENLLTKEPVKKNAVVMETSSSSKEIDVDGHAFGVKGFTEWSVPRYYKPVKVTPLAKCLIEVSVSPEKLRECTKKLDFASIPEYQAKALATRNSDWIRFAVRNNQVEVEKAMKKGCHNLSEERKKPKPYLLKAKEASLDSNDETQLNGVPYVPSPASPQIVGSDRVIMDSNGLSQVDGPPRTASPQIVGPDRVTMDSNGLSQVDGPPRTASPQIVGPHRVTMDSNGLSQVDGPPRTASPQIVGPHRVTMDSNGLSQVDGPPRTASPQIVGPDRVTMQ